MLKKKLKIQATQLIQASKVTELEKEKELLSQEFNDCKAKLLKLIGEKNQWEKERGFLTAKIDVLNENQLILEREKEDKKEREVIPTTQPCIETNNEVIV